MNFKFKKGSIKSNRSTCKLRKSWEDATKIAVEQAAKSLKNIRSVYVQEHSASVKDGKVYEYRVNLKLTFEIE